MRIIISKYITKKFLLTIIVTSLLITIIFFLQSSNKKTRVQIEEKIISELAECIKSKVKNDCYERISDTVLQEYSFEESLEIIKKYQEVDEIRDCHEFAHFVGKKILRRTNDLRSILISPNVNLCVQGFLHGAIIEHFKEMGITQIDKNDPKIRDEFANKCGTKDMYRFIGHFVECFHALGHVSMMLSANNLTTSLEICDVLKKPEYQESCYSGAFMEDFTNPQRAVKIKEFISKGNNNFPCNELDTKYLKICYRWKGEFFLEMNEDNFETSLTMCQKIKSEYVNECILRLARSYARKYYHQKDNVLSKCFELSDKNQNDFCLRGVVELLIGDVNDPKILNDYCNDFGEKKEYCYEIVFTSIDIWATDNKKEMNTACRLILDKLYQEKCISELEKKFL